MTMLQTNLAPADAARTRRVRIPTASRVGDTPESFFLRLWVAHQASRYHDLLATIDSAPRPRRGR
jgi:hypothetical protein